MLSFTTNPEYMAERVGFEPTNPCRLRALQARALDQLRDLSVKKSNQSAPELLIAVAQFIGLNMPDKSGNYITAAPKLTFYKSKH